MPVVNPYTDALLETPGLLGLWPLAEASGVVAADVVGDLPGSYIGDPGHIVFGEPPIIRSEPHRPCIRVAGELMPPGEGADDDAGVEIPSAGDILGSLDEPFAIGLYYLPPLDPGLRMPVMRAGHLRLDAVRHGTQPTVRYDLGYYSNGGGTVHSTTGDYVPVGPTLILLESDGVNLVMYLNGGVYHASPELVGGLYSDPLTSIHWGYIPGPRPPVGPGQYATNHGHLGTLFVVGDTVGGSGAEALFQASVLDPYQAQIGALPGLVSHWPLSEASGAVAVDTVDSNDGAYVGVAGIDYDHATLSLIPNEPGPSAASGSAAVTLDGGHIVVDDAASLQVPEAVFAGLTLSPAPGPFGLLPDGGLMQKGAFSSYDIRIFSTGRARFAVNLASGGVVWAESDPGLIEIDNVYNAVGIYDGSAVSLYVNAELVGSASASGSLNHDHSTHSHDLYVGAGYLAPGGVDRAFPGPLDEVFLGSAALPGSAVPEMHVAAVGALPPDVTTMEALAVGSGGATLRGAVNPNQWRTHYWFEWGPTDAYGSVAPVGSGDAGLGSMEGLVEEALSDLEPLSTYHYRLVAENDNGISLGGDIAFRTEGTPQGTIPSRIGIG